MARSAKALLAEASLKALSLTVLSHPIALCCGVVLSSLLEAAPLEDLAHSLGEELSKIVGIGIAERLTEVEPGSLPEAFLKALENAIVRVQKESLDALRQGGWERWFNNWKDACKKIKHHRWKTLRELTLAVGNLNNAPSDWPVLKETLVLLDWSARILSESAANRGEMPDGLSELLRADLGAAFIEELKSLLSKSEYTRAHVDTTIELASLAAAGAGRATGRRQLSGANDPRLRPMRGFFTGRTTDVQAVTGFLAGASKFAVVTGQLFNVQGGPGIGKTEVCKAALRAYLQEHPATRAYYIDVTGVRSVDELKVALAGALGNPKLAEEPIALLRELESESDLIYLDNLEDALPEQSEEGTKVFGWLEAMVQHEIRVLASSRRQLGSVAAQEFPLGRLSLAESKELFVHFWIQAGGSAIEDSEAFERFLERGLDRHALTIRLLALQGGEWKTWQNLQVQWLKVRTKLAEDAGRRDRLSSLDVSISLTFDQIMQDSTATDIWIAFPCFPEGMSSAAQVAVAPDEAERVKALRFLRTLGVIYLPEGDARERFEMLAPLRQFAVGLDPSTTRPVWERCLEYFEMVASWVRSTELGAGDQRQNALRMLTAEFGNLQESLFLAVEKNVSPGLLEQIHHALLNSYQFQAVASREMLMRLDGFFHVEGRVAARANTLKALGDLESRLGHVEEARRRYDEALPLYVSEQDNLGRANTLQALGDLDLPQDPQKAEALYEEALKHYESELEPIGIAATLVKLAMFHKLGKRIELAVDAAKQARAAAQASGVPAFAEWVEAGLKQLDL